MAHGGEAVARLPDGRAAFVAGGLPGETAPVRLTDEAARYARGVLAALPVPASAERVLAPRCPHFGAWPARGAAGDRFCGGCQWQYVDYAAQLRYKRSILADVLQRIGGLVDPPVAETLGMAEPWHYRNHVRLRMGREGWGFVAADHLHVAPIQVCHIAHPLVMQLMGLVDPAEWPAGTTLGLRAGIATGDQMIVLYCAAEAEDAPETLDAVEVDTAVSVVLVRMEAGDPGGSGGGARRSADDARGDTRIAVGGARAGVRRSADDVGGDARQAMADPDVLEPHEVALVAGRPYLVEAVAGRTFAIPPTGFFQANTAMVGELVALVRAAIPAGTGSLGDLYSGVGVFAISLSDLAGEVYAIEEHPAAVAAAVENAAGLGNVTLVEADAAEGLAYLEIRPDVVVVDPPRTGLDRAVVELLKERVRDTIVYVSCEPSTLARDLRQLTAAGWHLVSSQPVDMFPHTYHIESVNVLRR